MPPEVCTSDRSGIPLGGEIERLLVLPKKPTTRSSPWVVVTDGAYIVLVEAVYWPLVVSSGAKLSTPLYASIAPETPTVWLSVQT
jgi:hypothetical protein